jgi:hypothetical protein
MLNMLNNTVFDKYLHWPCVNILGHVSGTSWSLLGPGVEVGLTPNCMKDIHIFPLLIVEFDKYLHWPRASVKNIYIYIYTATG